MFEQHAFLLTKHKAVECSCFIDSLGIRCTKIDKLFGTKTDMVQREAEVSVTVKLLHSSFS